MKIPRLREWAVTATGLALMLNVPVIAGSEQSPRVLDLVGLGLVVSFCVTAAIHRSLPKRKVFAFAAVFTLLLPWLVVGLTSGNVRDAAIAGRWVLMLVVAAYLASLREPLRERFLVAAYWGAVASSAVVVLHAAGYVEETFRWGLASRDAALTTFQGAFRPPGLYGHPNASAAAVSLSLPLALALQDRRWFMTRLIVAGAAISLVTALTLTRSALICSGLTFAIWGFRSIRWRLSARALLLPTALAIGLGLLIWLGPPGGWDRWTDRSNLESNSSERLETTIASFELALEHPLGVGLSYPQFIRDRVGHGATHNAWSQLALIAGLPLALLALVATGASAMMLVRRITSESILALHVAALSAFEEHFHNPLIVVAVFWILLRWLDGRARRRKTAETGYEMPGVDKADVRRPPAAASS